MWRRCSGVSLWHHSVRGSAIVTSHRPGPMRSEREGRPKRESGSRGGKWQVGSSWGGGGGASESGRSCLPSSSSSCWSCCCSSSSCFGSRWAVCTPTGGEAAGMSPGALQPPPPPPPSSPPLPPPPWSGRPRGWGAEDTRPRLLCRLRHRRHPRKLEAPPPCRSWAKQRSRPSRPPGARSAYKSPVRSGRRKGRCGESGRLNPPPPSSEAVRTGRVCGRTTSRSLEVWDSGGPSEPNCSKQLPWS